MLKKEKQNDLYQINLKYLNKLNKKIILIDHINIKLNLTKTNRVLNYC